MPTAIELLAESRTFRSAPVPLAIIDRDFDLVMAECGCDREAALQVLVARSQKAQCRLRDVADELVREFEGGARCD